MSLQPALLKDAAARSSRAPPSPTTITGTVGAGSRRERRNSMSRRGREVLPGMRLGFDLLVNEMLPGRERRAGQLVWSGGAVWVYLQGDRHDPSRFGVLVLG